LLLRAVAPERSLDIECTFKQGPRRQRGFDCDHAINEGRLIGHAPGRRTVIGGARDQLHLCAVRKPPHGIVERRPHIADIAAKTDQRLSHVLAPLDCIHQAECLHGLGDVMHAHDIGTIEHGQHIAGNRPAEALAWLRC